MGIESYIYKEKEITLSEEKYGYLFPTAKYFTVSFTHKFTTAYVGHCRQKRKK